MVSPRNTDSAADWRRFEQTLAEVRRGFAHLSPEAAEALIAEAIKAARTETLRALKKEH